MKIYKIRAWVNQRKKGSIEHPFEFTEVVLHLDTAKRIYSQQLNQAKTWEGQKGIGSIHCELFIPHIHEDGTLAYWPNSNKYIEKYEG